MEGMLRWSVTAGIVSAVGPRLIQTETALNPGNSGGPVVDEEGRIVGIASRKLSGDNVAFLSASSNLLRLQESKWKPSILGGQFTFGLTSISPAEANAVSSLALVVGMVFRDRLVLKAHLAVRARRGAMPWNRVGLGAHFKVWRRFVSVSGAVHGVLLWTWVLAVVDHNMVERF